MLAMARIRGHNARTLIGAASMRYTLLTFLCLITVTAYVQRTAMNGATKTIEKDLGITSTDLGYVMGGWYLVYSLCQLPSGWVADRIGSKPALILFAIGWSLLTGIIGLATGFFGMLLLWGMMGGIQAGIFPCSTKAIGATFPRTEQAFASGMLTCCMGLGAALAPKLTTMLLDELTWQQIFALYSIPGLVWAVLFALIVPRPDSPRIVPAQPEDHPDDWHALPPTADTSRSQIRWLKLVNDRHMRLLCLQQFLRAGAMAMFFTWFARVLQESRGLDQHDAGSFAFWPPFIGAFGGMFGGLISDWLLRRTGNSRLARQGVTFTAMTIGTGVAFAAFFVADPDITLVLMSIAAFCGMAGGVNGYSLAITYGGKQVATVFATMNMSGNLGATMFSILAGRIGEASHDWNLVLLLFAGMFALSAACWAVLNPKGTLFENAEEARQESE
jgi:sugar phosphate permease